MPEADLVLMRRIDELHLQFPYYRARRLAKQLKREGRDVGRLHVRTVMQRMGIEALYRRPRTSIPARGASIYPYLLEKLAIERPGLGERHHVPADGARICLPGSDSGRRQPQSARLQIVQHAHGRFLRGCARRGADEIRATGDFQH